MSDLVEVKDCPFCGGKMKCEVSDVLKAIDDDCNLISVVIYHDNSKYDCLPILQNIYKEGEPTDIVNIWNRRAECLA